MKRWACAVGAAAILSSSATAGAAELIFLSNQGATPGVRALAEGFERASGHKVTVLDETGAAFEQRLANGPADLISLNPEAIAEFGKKGRVVADTITPFTLAPLGGANA